MKIIKGAVMSPEPGTFDAMIEHHLEPELYSMGLLRQFIQFLASRGIKHYPVHLKLDTGMHRLGFDEQDISQLLTVLENSGEILVQSVFSHLAASEDGMQDTYSKEQITRFTAMSNVIQQSLKYNVLRHILNSAGIERFPEAQFEMVRLGIGLYGISTVDQSKLRNIGTLKTIISQIKKIRKGETIGYGRKGIGREEMVLATLPIGYADGLNRKLSSGNAKFLLNGKFAPTVGNICMDMCMIDITGIQATEGDEVVIFGDSIPVTILSEAMQTIPYEVLTGISARVKRVYYQE